MSLTRNWTRACFDGTGFELKPLMKRTAGLVLIEEKTKIFLLATLWSSIVWSAGNCMREKMVPFDRFHKFKLLK